MDPTQQQPHPPLPPYGQPAPQPPRKRRTPVWLVVTVAVLLGVCGIGTIAAVATSGSTVQDGGQPGPVCAGVCDDSVRQEPQPAPEPEPEPDIADGIWTVGSDVEPGTYRTVDVASEYCYWAVLTSGTNGEDIQANYIGGGRPVVVIEEGQDFESSECGGWERVNLRRLMDNADPGSTVEDGIWTVGLDIRAGTYRPTDPAGDDCYWAVLEGRTNGDNIINNGLGGGRPTVSVERGQQLEVARCGTWERQ